MSKLLDAKVQEIERVLARDRDPAALRRLHEELGLIRETVAAEYGACRSRVIQEELLAPEEMRDIEYTLRLWDIEGYARRRAVKVLVERLPNMSKAESDRMHRVAEHWIAHPPPVP